MNVFLANTAAAIESCYPLMAELRSHLSKSDFVDAVVRLSETNQYQLVYMSTDNVVALAGLRFSEWLHTGKYIEIEELITSESNRSLGMGGYLFDWICEYGRKHQCKQVRLISGVNREDAHRFYERKGMLFEGKYFSLNL